MLACLAGQKIARQITPEKLVLQAFSQNFEARPVRKVPAEVLIHIGVRLGMREDALSQQAQRHRQRMSHETRHVANAKTVAGALEVPLKVAAKHVHALLQTGMPLAENAAQKFCMAALAPFVFKAKRIDLFAQCGALYLPVNAAQRTCKEGVRQTQVDGQYGVRVRQSHISSDGDGVKPEVGDVTRHEAEQTRALQRLNFDWNFRASQCPDGTTTCSKSVPHSTHYELKPGVTMTRLGSALGLFTLGWIALAANAQPAWPDKAIRVLLPFPPGGPSDIVMRLAAEKMQATLKQAIVIDNKPGAGGNLGAAEVARAAPDGYTWLWGTDTLVTVNPHVYKNIGYKVDDLLPVSIGTQFSQTLVCHPSVGVKTLPELIAKAKTGPLAYASGGAGVPGHLSMELLQFMAGFEMTHVPYKGPAPAMQDVLGGQVACGLLAGPTVLPQVRAGKLVALAVSGHTRSHTLPEVPTIAQAGVAGYEADFALVLFAPRGTPEAVVTRFRQAFVDALKSPDVTDKLNASDQVVVASTAAKAAATLAADAKKWGDVARRIKLGLD